MAEPNHLKDKTNSGPGQGPVFDVRVCQGRMCTANGADRLKDAALALLEGHEEGARCRLSRGGCFGLCDVGANVVVRRFARRADLPPEDQDRLTLTERKNETVYSGLTPDEVTEALRSHLEDDKVLEAVTRQRREKERPPEGPVAARMRELRARLARRKNAR